MYTSEKSASTVIEVPVGQFRQAMRELTGAVSVVTVGTTVDRTGFVATSVSSFSAEPPRLILCVGRNSSSWLALARYSQFGVNFMRETDATIADRFAGFGGVKGNDRYAEGEWVTLPSGTQVLRDALVSVDCTIEETFDRHDHLIVLGKVESIRVCDKGRPLLWFQSRYHHLGEPLAETPPISLIR